MDVEDDVEEEVAAATDADTGALKLSSDSSAATCLSRSEGEGVSDSEMLMLPV